MEACGFCSEPHLGGRNRQLAGSSHEKVKVRPVPHDCNDDVDNDDDDDDYNEPVVLEGESEPSPLAPKILSLPVAQVVHLEEARIGPDNSGQS